MNDEIERIFSKLRGTADFAETDFSDVNGSSMDGDKALHCVVRWGEARAAKVLINAGIDMNKEATLGTRRCTLPV